MLAFNRKLPTLLKRIERDCGVVAQLVEHLLCKQGVVSSSLISSTTVSMKLKRQERHPLRQPSPSRQFESDQLHHSLLHACMGPSQ